MGFLGLLCEIVHPSRIVAIFLFLCRHLSFYFLPQRMQEEGVVGIRKLNIFTEFAAFDVIVATTSTPYCHNNHPHCSTQTFLSKLQNTQSAPGVIPQFLYRGA